MKDSRRQSLIYLINQTSQLAAACESTGRGVQKKSLIEDEIAALFAATKNVITEYDLNVDYIIERAQFLDESRKADK